MDGRGALDVAATRASDRLATPVVLRLEDGSHVRSIGIKGPFEPSQFDHPCGVAVLLAFVATLYPSWAAARVKPADALRYE